VGQLIPRTRDCLLKPLNKSRDRSFVWGEMMEGPSSVVATTTTTTTGRQAADGDWSVGSSVAIETTLGERVEGVVYGFDRALNCVILQDAPLNPTQKKAYRLINVGFIRKRTAGPVLPSSTIDVRPVRPVDMGRIRAKEAGALAEAKKEAARINTNVGTDAQKIFNALAKTLPCRWDNDTIVIFDDLRLASPYRVEDVLAGAMTSKNELDRVKRVLDGELRRLGLSK